MYDSSISALKQIISYMNKIEWFLRKESKENFVYNRLLVDFTLSNFDKISAAVGVIPAEVRTQHAHIPWQDLSQLRQTAYAGGQGADPTAVWTLIKQDLPKTQKQLEAMLDELRIETDDGK